MVTPGAGGAGPGLMPRPAGRWEEKSASCHCLTLTDETGVVHSLLGQLRIRENIEERQFANQRSYHIVEYGGLIILTTTLFRSSYETLRGGGGCAGGWNGTTRLGPSSGGPATRGGPANGRGG